MKFSSSETISYLREVFPRTSVRLGMVILLWTLIGSLSAAYWWFVPQGNYPYTWWELHGLKLFLWFMWGSITPYILWLSSKYPIEKNCFKINVPVLLLSSIVIVAAYLVAYTLTLVIYLPQNLNSDTFANMFSFVIKSHSTFYYLAFWLTIGLEQSMRFYRQVQDSKLLSTAGTSLENKNGNPISHLPVRIGRRLILISVEEIDWIEAADYYVNLHCNGKTHLVRKSMRWLESRLDPARFVRIHRSSIVNLKSVQEIRSPITGSNEVILSNGSILEMSRRRRSGLEQLIRQSA